MNVRFVQLSDVCDLQNGFAFKSTDYVEKSNTCNIRMSNIRPGGSFNEFHNERYLPDSYAKEYKDYLLNDGDLIIAMTDMATETKILGLPTLVNNTSGRSFLLNQRVGKLCKFSKEIYVPYLRHILTAQDVIDYYKSKGAGGLQINISKKDILSVKFPLPAIPTQQKIVAKLDAIFAEIETATAAAKANANNAEALFQSFLENLFLRISEANKPFKLSNFIKLEYGKGLEDSDRELNGIYGAYGANGIKSKTNKFLYDKPSIVVGRKGSAGELTLVEEKFWALDVTYYVTHDIKKTDLTFLYYALKMLNIPSLAKGIKPGINRNDVYDLTIAVPILSEQKLLVEKILFVNKNLEIAKNLYKSKCNELEILKQSILKKAFSGELVKD